MSFTEDSEGGDWNDIKVKSEKTPKTKYSQKFCDKWMNLFYPWLARCDDDPNKPFCKACQTRLDCNRCHLQRHEQTSKHARNLEILINKGESAARQNLSIRQERSKYYQQRKKHNPITETVDEIPDIAIIESQEDYIEEYSPNRIAAKVEPDGSQAFQFVHSDAMQIEQYQEDVILKQESSEEIVETATSTPLSKSMKGNTKVVDGKKERIKLFMQIQKDKNDLMNSFRDLVGTNNSVQQSPPREKSHLDLFFESVSSSIKALTPKLIAEAKMRVSQLVCELELRALTENDSNGAEASNQGTVMVTSDSGGAYIINQPVTTVVHTDHNQSEGEQHYGPLS